MTIKDSRGIASPPLPAAPVRWKCCGCGVDSPGRTRRCDCPTATVYRDGNPEEIATKIVPHVYVCSNPKCGAVFDFDPCGHCPVCILPSGVGWSTRQIDVRTSAAPVGDGVGGELVTAAKAIVLNAERANIGGKKCWVVSDEPLLELERILFRIEDAAPSVISREGGTSDARRDDDSTGE